MLILIGVISLDFPHTVDSAIISPEGAFLFVRLKLNAKGKADVKISKLPTSIGENVKIGIRKGILANMGFETQKSPYDSETYKNLEKGVEMTEKVSSRIKAELSEVEYYINLLNSALDGIKNGKGDNIREYLNLSKQLSNYHIKKDSLSKILGDLTKKLDSLRALKGRYLTEQGVINLYIEKANNPIIDMLIFYPLGNLGWKPEYTVEYKTGGNMKIYALAKFISNLPRKVSAKKVIITNIAPSFSEPFHTPWYISDRPPIIYRRRSGFVKAQEAKRLATAPETEQAEIPKTPEITFTPISTRFVINKEITFDRFKPAIAELFEKTYKVKEVIFIYPELSEKSYIKAVFKPDMDLPSGNVKVFFNGELSADYFYKGAQRGDEDTIFLGFDPYITGKIKLLDQERRDIRGKNKTVLTKERRIYEITITNHRDSDVNITLFIRKPFSSGNVNVIDFSVDPKPKKDLGDGLLMWKVRLKPKGNFTVKREITITYPKGNFVNW